MGCLDDNTAVDFAGGNLPRPVEARVEAHLATCRDCRTLVAALAPSAHDSDDSDIVTAPRHYAHGKKKHGANAVVTAALSPTEPRGSEPRRPLEPVVAVGDTISRYVVLRRIGAGGMGVVYAAYDPQLDRKVALKLLRTGIGLGEGEARARLVREAQAIAQLSHPHVVAVYDVGTTVEGEVYVAMEFVDGDTLTQWLHRWDRPWREILEVFRDAGRGLAAAHGVGLLHRDFKPDNVLVGADGRVRVTDFGLARSLVTGAADEGTPSGPPAVAPLRVTLTATGAVMGTPRYMAPEQLRGLDVSAAADQFSFCVALYEALYGHHPIAGDTAVKIVEEGARAQPPAAPERAPAWVWPVLARGLDPQPAKRFPSVAALLVELTPPAPSPRRRTYVAFAAATALVLGGAAAATVLVPKPMAPQIDPQLIADLTEKFEQSIGERDELIKQIAIMQATEDKNEAQLVELANQIVVKQQEINTLKEELSKVTGVAVIKPKPRPPRGPIDAGGVSQLNLKQGVEAKLDRFAGCMREWGERSMGTAAKVTIGFRIEPDGRVRDPMSTGLDDRIVPQCLATALAAQMFPTAPRVTKAEIDVVYVDGSTRVASRHLGTEEPSPRIEE